MKDCIFCQIIKKRANVHIVDENENVIVFMSLENHPIIVTKKHIPNIYLLDNKIASDVMIETVKIAKAVKKAFKCDGVNIIQSNGIAAGQDVFHFHLHVKPRLYKDKVVLSWNNQIKSDKMRKKMSEAIKKEL